MLYIFTKLGFKVREIRTEPSHSASAAAAARDFLFVFQKKTKKIVITALPLLGVHLSQNRSPRAEITLSRPHAAARPPTS